DASGQRIDECMAVYMCAPATYTREDVVEFQLHGGAWAARQVMRALQAIGIRPAEPGEFTRRAFLNGRIDLSQAEAVMSLIRAESDRAAKAALRRLDGGVSAFVRKSQEALLSILAGVEAALDYPEEIDEAEACGDLAGNASALAASLRASCDRAGGRLLSEGFTAVLCGSVNAGKSSLLNALCGERRAIVTSVPGTTRDIVEGTLQLDGVRVRLVDTAGLRDSEEEVEKIGIGLARTAIDRADLLIIVRDLALPIDEETQALIRETEGRPRIIVLNKRDLADPDSIETDGPESITVSALTGEGIDTLRESIQRHIPKLTHAELTEDRHIRLATIAADALDRAAATANETGLIDLAAVHLHEALDALQGITGDRVDEKLLDDIFSRFCVGK
ncbi:MAG: tRNA uridine-5-carboxymethylaminomethyl(34) synthesis GTPase MnmE, partial [Clostridia bacterium]|nr:tRNA uridine-5-carboxymethylaminomethyl(34) synthesis GTPase MnmE [Clostridia bacterium]